MSDEKFLQPPKSRKGLWLGLGLAAALAVGLWVGRQVVGSKQPGPEPAAVVTPEPPTGGVVTAASVSVRTEAAPVAAAPAAVPTNNAPAALEQPVVPPPAPPPTVSDPGPEKLAAARSAWQAARGQEARGIVLGLLDQSTNAVVRRAAEDLLSEIDTTLVFSRRPMAEKVEYTVQAGDTLEKLARKFATTKELIRRGNNFTGDVVRLGDRLRIFNSAFGVQVSRTRNELVLSAGGKFFKRYAVGTGEYSMTPTGTFHIVSRIAGPTWYRPGGAPIPFGDTNNVLGTHWLALDVPHYGLHGTWDTNSIGKQSSQGCIRLLNGDIEELYALLPEGTPVTINE